MTNEDAYEQRVGRWSRLVAPRFLEWLDLPRRLRWLDIGGGTGALSAAIADRCSPATLVVLDRAIADLSYGRARGLDGGARSVVADASRLPFGERRLDVVVSALSLNFLPDPPSALQSMSRLTRPRGRVAAYVWDFAGEMQPHRRFWDAAIALDPGAARHDQANKFSLCRLDALEAAFVAAGLREVETRQIDVPAEFQDFDDLWLPFVTGDGSVVDYTHSLGDERLRALREQMRGSVAIGASGGIRLLARAFAARGIS